MKFKKYERVLTPSGLWDNGRWELSDNEVEFPATKLKDAIIENVSLFRGTADRYTRLNFNAFKVTIDGTSWLIDKNPKQKSK